MVKESFGHRNAELRLTSITSMKFSGDPDHPIIIFPCSNIILCLMYIYDMGLIKYTMVLLRQFMELEKVYRIFCFGAKCLKRHGGGQCPAVGQKGLLK